MWSVSSLTNNYELDVALNYVVLSGATVTPPNFPLLGDARTVALNVPYKGIAYFKDIGTTPLGPSTQTFGVLITFDELNWVFRYEGNGQLAIVVGSDGALSFTSPSGGTINPVTLVSFPGFMRTYNGKNFVSMVSDGGLGAGASVPITTTATTVGENEQFILQWTDIANRKFALITASGKYVTAVNGGGIGGSGNDYPLVTNATENGEDELLEFVIQPSGKYAVRSKSGYYWTATNGGGWGEAANAYPIHTDAGKLGGWETFTLVPPDGHNIPEDEG